MIDRERFELRMNVWMRPLYEGLSAYSPEPLPSDLAEDVGSGLVIADGCVCIRSHVVNLARAPEPKDSYREWWTNEIGLDSTLKPSDPAWRLQLLSWGIELAQMLLEQAIPLCGEQRVQALLNLQSPLGQADPEFDFACGSLFFYSVRDVVDDYSLPSHLEPLPDRRVLPQPVLTMSHGHALDAL